MAASSKRPKPKSDTQKKAKTVKKRRSARRGKSKKRNDRSLFIRRVIVGLVVVGFLIAVGYSYMTTDERAKAVVVDEEVIYPYSQEEILKELSQIRAKHPPKHPTKEIEQIHKQVQKKKQPRKIEQQRVLVDKEKDEGRVKKERSVTAKAPVAEGEKAAARKSHKGKVALAYRGKRPRLVIIIDDVHTRSQLEAIRTLPFHVTPSIFPPYTLAKHSNRLAEGLNHYMIHLPMESGSAQFNAQTKTLMRSFTKSQMRERVKELRRLFPNAVYINNHTGSTFTSNYRAMKELYDLLKAEGFVFVDSFTVGSSKVKKIAHEEGDAYVRRDIFIDNRQDIGYIHNQLKKAVKVAEKNGYAIAIGHPHKSTIKALKEAKPILKDVDVVYIDEIYKRE